MHSIILSFELLERLLLLISSSVGNIGFLDMTLCLDTRLQTHTGNVGGHMHGFSNVENATFTIRSSREWKDIIARRPPGFNELAAFVTAISSISSSLLTSILNA